MWIKTKTNISFILGQNIIYQTSCQQELFKDKRKGDIYEEFADEDKKSLKISKIRYFNKVDLPKSLTHLKFGHCFNKSIILPEGITHLTFGFPFNQKVKLPEGLTHLTFGFSFNQLIELPKSLIHLTFGDRFNQPVILPKSLTHLTFGSRINKPINLPKSLTHLTLGWNFNYCHQKDLKVKYNNKIIKIQNLPINISYYY